MGGLAHVRRHAYAATAHAATANAHMQRPQMKCQGHELKTLRLCIQDSGDEDEVLVVHVTMSDGDSVPTELAFVEETAPTENDGPR